MVRFTVLASGSKGNCTVISGGRTRILLDAGLSCRELFRRMRLAGEDPETLDAVIITHEHSDHVSGLAVTARKLGIPVYFTEGTHRAWMRWLTPRRQMSYAQWLEQCRKQVAERQAEADASALEGEADESDLIETAGELSEERTAGAKQAAEKLDFSKVAKNGSRQDDSGTIRKTLVKVFYHRFRGCFGPIPSFSAACKAQINDGGSTAVGVKTPAYQSRPDAGPTLDQDSEAAPPSRKADPTWLPAVEYFEAGRPFEIGDIAISPFTIPHDAADPVGFVFRAEGVRMAYATDLGYIPPNVKAQLKGVDLLMLESNHDLEMLRDGPYPWQVKQRVLSRVGHLSNEAAAEFLEEDYDGQAAYVILAHLSESNNLPDLARVTAERALNGRASLLANRLLLAMQHESLSGIQF